MENTGKYLAKGAIVAALYVVLTFVSSAFGLSSGVIQLRLSEALTILPAFLPAAVPGLFAGCFLANLLTGCAAADVVFGSLATLLGAIGTRKLREHKILRLIPPILSCTLVIPLVLVKVYCVEEALIYVVATVFLGELLSCGLLGSLLGKYIEKHAWLREILQR